MCSNGLEQKMVRQKGPYRHFVGRSPDEIRRLHLYEKYFFKAGNCFSLFTDVMISESL